MRNKKKKMTFPNYIDFNGQLVTNRRLIINKFNSYFVNIAENLNNKKCTDEFSNYKLFMKNRVNSTIFLNDIDSHEIESIIDSLNPNKSSDMSPRVLNFFKHILSPIISVIFNNCMYSGIFPASLKIAKLISIFKAGDINEISNYRPISLLPVFSKIFEKIIHTGCPTKSYPPFTGIVHGRNFKPKMFKLW